MKLFSKGQRAALFILWLALAVPAARAATNEFVCTFTNRLGVVFNELKILSADPSGFFFWTTNGAGGRVRFEDAPEFLRARFDYSPGRAVEFDARTAAARRAYQAASDLKARRDAAAKAAKLALDARREAFWKTCQVFSGVVFQRSKGVILAQWIPKDEFGEDSKLPVFLLTAVTNFPAFTSVKSGDRIMAVGHHLLDFEYENSAGDRKAVPLIDCRLPDEWKDDAEIRRRFSANSR